MPQLKTLGRTGLIADDATPLGAPAQPKRMALLAYLAVATTRSAVRRDALLALFWPELGDEDGRRALRQALHYLRRTAGEAVIDTAGDEVRVQPGELLCDAVEFERLLEEGRPEEALSFYEGDFLAGFHVPDVAVEYEEWVERTRGRLRRRASQAAWSVAAEQERLGRAAEAVEAARRACHLEPDDEAGWRRLMELQDRLGERAGALRTYEELAQRLERDFESGPAAETRRLAEQIRTAAEPYAGEVPAPAAAERPAAVSEGGGATRPAEARAAGARPARRRSLAATVVIAALLLAGAVGLASRAERRESPSLIASGELASRDRILVADFADAAGDASLAAAITEAFRIDLSQSPLVRVLTPRQVRGTLARMEQSEDIALNDSLAREVALRDGVKAFVTGSIARLGGGYTVSVQLVGAQRGEALTSVRETAADSSGLIAAVDRASKTLRHNIGESLRELRGTPRLEEVTTGSLEALRKYTEGQHQIRSGNRKRGIDLYTEAVALDSGFASAHLSLGMAYSSIGETGRGLEATRHALANQDRLPYLERGFLVASHAYTRTDYETASDAYRRVLERYPDNIFAMNNLALIERDRRAYTVAESLFARAAELDSTIANFYFGMHSTQVLRGRFDESRRTLDELARRFPDNPVIGNVEIQDAAAQQDWDAAERRAEAKIAEVEGDSLNLVDPYEALAGIVMTQGRLAEARRHWRTHLEISKASGSYGRHLFGVRQLASIDLHHGRAPEKAIALVDSALAALPLDSALPGDRPYDELARWFASAGDVSRAQALLAAAAENDRVLGRTNPAERSWTRGAIALAERNFGRAESELRQAAETHVCAICPLPDLGRAYEAAGKTRAAVTVYERYVSTPWLWRYEVDAVELGWVLRRLGELHAGLGNRAAAADAYASLLRLWRRADPALEPLREEARTRLASLRGGE